MDNKIKTSPKDFFMHLLAIITLYVSVVSFITLVFQYINVLFPDVLERGGYYVSSAYSSIRWAISALVVFFPIYIFTSWSLEKDYQKNSGKRDLKIRRWLVYFTLFAAALIIAGDLVALVFKFLGGELTARFALKVLTIFLVIGIVFGYYFWDLKTHKRN